MIKLVALSGMVEIKLYYKKLEICRKKVGKKVWVKVVVWKLSRINHISMVQVELVNIHLKFIILAIKFRVSVLSFHGSSSQNMRVL